jgi:hypothetical protein
LTALVAALAALLVYGEINWRHRTVHQLNGYIGDSRTLDAEYVHFLGTPLRTVEIRHQFEQAAGCVEKGDYYCATTLLEQTAKYAPLPVVFNDLGVLYAQLNDPSRAVNAFREALARDASYGPVRSNMKRLPGLSEHIADPVSTEVEPNDNIASANIVTVDKPVDAAIKDPTDRDFFRFTTPPPPRDRLEISVLNRSKTLAPRLRIYDADGLILPLEQDQVEPGGSLSLVMVPKANTTFYLNVVGIDESFGAYTLSLKALKSFDRYEPNDDIFSARKITLGQRIDANIMDAEDTDFYSFESPRTGTVSIDVENHSDVLVPALTTFAPDKRTSGFGPDVGPGASLHHILQVEQGQTYYVQVWSQAKTSGDYSLIVQ